MKFLRMASLLAAAATLAISAPKLEAAPKKKLVVVTVTTGFRHGSIPTAETVLKELSDKSSTFEIVGWIRQPDVEVPKKPNEPKPLAPDADDNAKKKYREEMQKYRDEKAKYDPVKAEALQKQFDEEVKEALSKLTPENLDKYGIDGVIFANTTGNLPLPDQQAFVDWIGAGHAFIGMHSATDTLREFHPYIGMVGGEFDGHPWTEHVTIKVEDNDHPAAGDYRDKFEIEDEIYQFQNWERDKVHMIFSLDESNAERPKKMQDGVEKGFFERGKRADNDYAVSWVRNFGDGRVFYSSLGHRDDVWTNPEVQKHFVGGIEWALGLQPGKGTATN